MKLKYIGLSLLFASLVTLSCSKDDGNSDPNPVVPPVDDMTGFAKGADVSWVTEMENNGILFYNASGTATECFKLMKSLGMNSIRLRVWVNPTDGWCNKTDLLLKAKRANDLGMRILIDFHYSDTWADPGTQTKPAAWASLSFTNLCTAVTNHTNEVLNALKSWKITPEWVQVGNETSNGMLWDDGKADVSMAQYATLNNCGYYAAKAIFPNVKVVIHLNNGQTNSLYRWMFDGLKTNNAKYDVIGMSLYPAVDTWQTYNNNCIANMNDMVSRYNKDVMLCEVGMPWNEADASFNFLTDLITQSKTNSRCLGVFYWEPQAYNGWKSYSLGAFDNNGKPTKAMDAFK